jgi:hypothetical protein
MALMTSEYRSDLMIRLLRGLPPPALARRCMKCRSTKRIEWHHVCGQQLDPECLAGKRGRVVPLCHSCHKGRWGIHKALTQAKVTLEYTPDDMDRKLRARRAFLVFLWWLDDPSEPNHSSNQTVSKGEGNEQPSTSSHT